jgi:hypothetical protein
LGLGYNELGETEQALAHYEQNTLIELDERWLAGMARLTKASDRV